MLLVWDSSDHLLDTIPMASFPEVLLAPLTLPDVAHRVGGVFRSLFGIDLYNTAVADATAFGLGRQFDFDSVVVQLGELTLDFPRHKEDRVVRLGGELSIASDHRSFGFACPLANRVVGFDSFLQCVLCIVATHPQVRGELTQHGVQEESAGHANWRSLNQIK